MFVGIIRSVMFVSFFPGNDYLHEISSQAKYTLRVDLTSFNDSTAYAEYSTFVVGPESNNYTVTVGGYQGTAGKHVRLAKYT